MTRPLQATLLALMLLPLPALAYIGPGVGLSALGSILAFIAVVLLLLVGFFWYPIKRLLGRGEAEDEDEEELDEDSDQSSGL